jgi:hypothetical protein
MEEITSNGFIAIIASIGAAFCLGIALVSLGERDAEKHWRSMDKEEGIE